MRQQGRQFPRASDLKYAAPFFPPGKNGWMVLILRQV
jgi:hypothetical protein